MGAPIGYAWATSSLENSVIEEAQRRWELDHHHVGDQDDSETSTKAVRGVLEEVETAFAEWKKDNRFDVHDHKAMDTFISTLSQELQNTKFATGEKKKETSLVYWRKKKRDEGNQKKR